MTIVYLTFGDKTEFHVQAYLSMLSFRRQMAAGDRLVMVTNVPDLYRRVASWVEVVAISDEQIREWKGWHDYVFRVKTMAIRQLTRRYADSHLLFLDTDTFLYGSLGEMRRLLDSGQALLHKDEGHPKDMKGPSRRMWQTVEGRVYAGVTMGSRQHMWNSGVIGMPSQLMQPIIDDALTILDAMLDDGVKSFNIEQYAMSVAMLKHARVVEGEPYVGHYWGNKDEWGGIAARLLLRSYMRDSTLEEELEQVTGALLRSAPLFVHRSNTARRLKALVDRLFPDSGERYAGPTGEK